MPPPLRRLIPHFCALGVLGAHLSIPLASAAKPAPPPPLPTQPPPLPPTAFNPDPGAWDQPSPQTVQDNVAELPLFGSRLQPYGTEALLPNLDLPRENVTSREYEIHSLPFRDYNSGAKGPDLPPNTQAFPNRWRVPLPHWQRYLDPSTETPYLHEKPKLWHPYHQSVLKGDLPIFGQDLFANITAKSFTVAELRKVPVPSGVSTARANSAEFFGKSEQAFVSTDTSVAVDLFRGETAFKPVTWLFHLTLVQNENWIWTRENNQVNPDPRGSGFPNNAGNPSTGDIQAAGGVSNSVNPASGNPGNFGSTLNPGDLSNYLDNQGLTRTDGHRTRYVYRHKDVLSLQEAFLETHISDLSLNYDFITSRVGIFPFVSDFRGFIFSDSNLGARLFGNAANNRSQYNLLYFNMREKDTYSELNTFDSRHQQVLIANFYQQDFLKKGYTSQWSLHANFDGSSTRYDRNGFLVRPAPFGSVTSDESGVSGHSLQSYYLGWTGDGHIGKLNINHAFYQVFGRDEFNQFAGRKVDINAQMAALELSVDRDWIRFKLSGFYASGDSNPTDGVARGFDSIQDNPFFIGGPFSWYVREGFNLAGTSIGLKDRNSLLPNFRSSKTQGQSNFVNPGALIVGVGTDVDVTPKLKAFANLNYIRFAETAPIKVALQSSRQRSDLGLDASFGVKYRPFLTDNVIISAGMGFFIPGGGFRDIYRQNTTRVRGFDDQSPAGKTDPFLYNALLTVTLTY